MSATRNAAFNGKGEAGTLNLRIVGGFAQHPHGCPVSAGWLDFLDRIQLFSEVVPHLFWPQYERKKLTEVKEAFQLNFMFYPPI